MTESGSPLYEKLRELEAKATTLINRELTVYKQLYELYSELTIKLMEHNSNYKNMISREKMTEIRTLEKILGITNFPKKK